MKNVRAAGILYFVASAPLVAQSAVSTPPVEIRTSAVTTIELPAAGAVLAVNFSTQRKTPGEAGRANAERATAIRRAILALGVPGDSITTRGYSSTLNVGPYGRDTTFVASNTVHVRMSRLALISAVIDTALAEGATGIAGLQFWSDGVAQARLDAIAAATRRARTQAETLAGAAGGRVGRLLELATDPPSGRGFSPFDLELSAVTSTASYAPTPIQAPTVKVAVTVYTRWEFLPDRE